ncbi:NmrA family protein [Klebsiella pneumoniae]|uniref:NmrA family protein n=1 Tax=Klebsiella pneumoniae TaxID=573 RepID=A0A377TUN0_KLEPN|nr:NmrA family protein [Klebsiella pneumoniae]
MRKPCWFLAPPVSRAARWRGRCCTGGWRVRALVRDPFSAGAAALAARGAELVVGTFEDRAAMRSAMAGVDGVFSVQPSSPGGTVTDEQEVRYGITIADLAVECG